MPTILVAFTRHSRDQSFSVLAANLTLLVAMAAGSVLGIVVAGALLGVVPSLVLIPVLAALPILSSIKVRQHR